MDHHSAAITAPSAVADAEQRAPRVVHTIAEAREALAEARLPDARLPHARLPHARLSQRTVGFVPTMGALHEGHLSLISQAAQQCDVVAVSVFVNPTQFDEQADLAAYPRELERDVTLARQAGAHIVFAPSAQEMYPSGFATSIHVGRITETLEGEMRGASHFDGMCTVVCKLLNIVQPTIAYFGQKDAQQAAVVKRLVADLDIPTAIETLPTVREHDGLALSSRNARLSPAQRMQALGLHAALLAAEERAVLGERSCSALLAAASQAIARYGMKPEYIEIVDGESWQRVESIEDEALMLIAARVGQTRLIDNIRLRCPTPPRQLSQPLPQPATPAVRGPAARTPNHTKET